MVPGTVTKILRHGKLTHDRVTYPALANSATVNHHFDYEWHGNPARKAELFAGEIFTPSYAWLDQGGGLQQVTDPSGRVVANTTLPAGSW